MKNPLKQFTALPLKMQHQIAAFIFFWLCVISMVVLLFINWQFAAWLFAGIGLGFALGTSAMWLEHEKRRHSPGSSQYLSKLRSLNPVYGPVTFESLEEKEYLDYLKSIGAIREDGTIDRSKIKYYPAQTYEELEAWLTENVPSQNKCSDGERFPPSPPAPRIKPEPRIKR